MPDEAHRASLATSYDHCLALVREHDRDRYHAGLFAPAAARPHLYALAAFSIEISRIRDAVSAPMPGEIRLQWWRDAVEGLRPGDAAAHPVAAALLGTVESFSLPRQALVDLIDARVFDLYDDPMPSTGDLEGYLGETSSAPIRLAALVLAGGRDPGGADAAGHAGVAIGIANLLHALPWHARQGRLYVPADILDRHGVTRDDVVLGRGGPGFQAAIADLGDLARRHLERARALRPTVDPATNPAFLPASLVSGDLDRVRRGLDLSRPPPDRPEWRRIATLWWASRRGW